MHAGDGIAVRLEFHQCHGHCWREIPCFVFDDESIGGWKDLVDEEWAQVAMKLDSYSAKIGAG